MAQIPNGCDYISVNIPISSLHDAFNTTMYTTRISSLMRKSKQKDNTILMLKKQNAVLVRKLSKVSIPAKIKVEYKCVLCPRSFKSGWALGGYVIHRKTVSEIYDI
jgi:hypothetical protein